MRVDTTSDLLSGTGVVGALAERTAVETTSFDLVLQAAGVGAVGYSKSFEPSTRPAPVPPGGVKRWFDVTAALLGLIALAPLLLLIAAIIKLTSQGPVFFRQNRVGYGNQLFQIYKFRSMYIDRCDHSGVAQTKPSDDRVTPIGRFIRRTSIDELPQLINVLLGDMSLVGPRPHVPGMLAAGVHYEDLVPNYAGRHRVRPGITGLAQVNGLRGPTVNAAVAIARVERDLEYVETQNLMLDIKIIALTVWKELRGGSGH